MAQATKIEWSDFNWNPIRGCSRVSAGCDNCYAMNTAHRFSGEGMPYDGLTVVRNGKPDWTSKIMLVEKGLLAPLRWQKPRKIFVASMSDPFHHNVPDEYLDKMFAVMALCPQHTFQLLTKRPERMKEYLLWEGKHRDRCTNVAEAIFDKLRYEMPDDWHLDERWPLKNVWLGVSVEDQKTADERIPLLLQTPAAVRWISAEPLLGPINLKGFVDVPRGADPSKQKYPKDFSKWDEKRQNEWFKGMARATYIAQCKPLLDWVVVGGESGPHARPMQSEWARLLRDQCKAAGVAFFFKQWGAFVPNVRGTIKNNGSGEITPMQDKGDMILVGKKKAGRVLDGFEHNEYPNEVTA